MCVEVRLVASGLSESKAFELEMDRIAFWRLAIGKELTNLTDGGEGSSGMKYDKKRRAKISVWAKKLKHSEKTKK